jgi:hypothetical protein
VQPAVRRCHRQVVASEEDIQRELSREEQAGDSEPQAKRCARVGRKSRVKRARGTAGTVSERTRRREVCGTAACVCEVCGIPRLRWCCGPLPLQMPHSPAYCKHCIVTICDTISRGLNSFEA